MGFSLKTHESERVKGTTQRRITKIRPYIRLNYKNGPPVFLQAGKVYSESGQVVEMLPEWFDEQVQHCSKDMLKLVQFERGKAKQEVKKKPGKKRGRPKVIQEQIDGNDQSTEQLDR